LKKTGLLIFLLLSLSFIILSSHVSLVYASWLSGWKYRKSHLITNSTNAGTNYQVNITVHYGSGTDLGANVYCDSKCKTDFGDIRFTDNDETTVLDCWNETFFPSDNITFWVEIQDDLSTENVTIYLYYGNPSANSISDISKVWWFSYDPDDDAVGSNPTGWTLTEGVGRTVEVSDEQAKFGSNSVELNDTTEATYCSALRTLLLEKSVSMRLLTWVWRGQTNMECGGSPRVEDGSGNNAVYFTTLGDGNFSYYDDSLGGWQNLTTYNAEQWYRIEIVSVCSNGDFNIKIDGTWFNDKDFHGNPTEFDRIFFATSTSGNPVLLYFDVVCWGKYVEPEPSHDAWGSEETIYSVNFRFNVGGQFRVDNATVTNGTTYSYTKNGTVYELVAIPKNSSYVFVSFNWSSSSVTNPYNLTVTQNETVWCIFDSTPEGEAPIRPYCVYIGHNSSLGGNTTLLYAKLKTDSGTLSYARWCHNNTGSYVNGSWLALSGSEDNINTTINLGMDYDDIIGFKVYMNNSLGNYAESKTTYLFGVDDPPIKELNLIPFLFVGACIVAGLIAFVFILSRRKKK